MIRFGLLMCLSTLVCGCASGPNIQDPYEPFNRKMYAFNDAVDTGVLKPVARGYEKVLPQPARTGISNFFRNLGVIVTTLNDALQLKYEAVPVDIMRFSTNLIFGLGGVFDVATELGIPYNDEDLGQTLGYWGVPSGPYVVLPFFGPSTVRDGLALPVDIYVSPAYDTIGDNGVRWGLLALYIVNTRANLLGAESFMQQAALDEYSFLRDSYLQRREYLVRDGKLAAQRDGGSPDRPKSLLELEQEDFGDDTTLQRPQRDGPKSLRELELEDFGDEPVFENDAPSQ